MDKQWIQREVLLLRRSLGMDSRISAHSFRHAYATRCYENGMDLLTLKAYLGHSSINSTCIYVRLAASYKEGFYIYPLCVILIFEHIPLLNQ